MWSVLQGHLNNGGLACMDTQLPFFSGADHADRLREIRGNKNLCVLPRMGYSAS